MNYAPQSSLIEHKCVLKVAQMIESVSLDVERQRMLGVVIEDRVNILQSLQGAGQFHLG